VEQQQKRVALGAVAAGDKVRAKVKGRTFLLSGEEASFLSWRLATAEFNLRNAGKAMILHRGILHRAPWWRRLGAWTWRAECVCGWKTSWMANYEATDLAEIHRVNHSVLGGRWWPERSGH